MILQNKYIVLFSLLIILIVSLLFLLVYQLNKNYDDNILIKLYKSEAFIRQDAAIEYDYKEISRINVGIYKEKFINIDYSEQKTIDEIVENVRKKYILIDSSTDYYVSGIRSYYEYDILSKNSISFMFYKDSIYYYDLSVYLPLNLDSTIDNYKIDSIEYCWDYGYNKDNLFSFVRNQRNYKILQLKIHYDFMLHRNKSIKEIYENMLKSNLYQSRDSLKQILNK